ncbi:peptidylprolyl isomerase [Fructilactobacillus florum]|uniref:Foldase protein PrsA n=1 Tax=Fructilactobacillus florum DSM 22689 = JCM 16035 TaxID=1423745 RepID=A0A0R2CJR5_9LACO|nr:peptidylprolyl isomerase [Fructilactobacillus florum]KRM91854.1 Foldase protein prsA [Fructilactobacillus florum DSM 22689 = JCM 16035]
MKITRKKIALGAAGVLMSLSLAACGAGGKSVATTNGGKITQEDFYNKLKKSPQGKQQLQQMILHKVLEKQYGDKVKNSDVDKQLNQYKSQYGSQFKALLQQQGMTESTLKQSLKDQLMLKQAVMARTDFSNKQLEKQFKSFQPKVTVQTIMTKDKDTAQNAINDLNNGKKWNDVVKQYSEDESNKNNGGKTPPFDNSTQGVESSVKQAAFKLKDGDYSTEPIKTQQGYAVIKMVKHPKKGSLNDHKEEVKQQLATKRMSDSNTMHKVVSEVLKDGDVHINDNDLKDVLSGYVEKN